MGKVGRDWSADEMEFLRSNYHDKTAEEIGLVLNRTRGMVYKKAQHLRLVKAKRWLMPEVTKIRSLLANPDRRPSPREIALHLNNGRSGQAVEGVILRYQLLDPIHKVFRGVL